MDTLTKGATEDTSNETHEPEGLAAGQNGAAPEVSRPDYRAENVARADRQQQAAQNGAATDAERIAVKIAAYRQEVALWNRVGQLAVLELRSGVAPVGSVLDLLDFVQGKIDATGAYNVQ